MTEMTCKEKSDNMENNEIASNRIVEFLTGNGTTTEGFTLDDILAMSDEELESNHQYIQWLFPLNEPSKMVPGAPYLTSADTALLAANPAAKASILKGLARMKSFYENTNFITPFNHNLRRISRILKSLVLMGLRTDAEVFREFIVNLADTPFKRLCIEHADRQLWQPAVRK